MDQIRFSQDQLQRNNGKYTYMKYDAFGREIERGLTTYSPGSYYSEVSGIPYEYRRSLGHGNFSLPRTGTTRLIETYYDGYSYATRTYQSVTHRADNSVSVGIDNNVVGLQTAQRIAILNENNYGQTKGKYIHSTIYYDSKSRPVHTIEDNYQGGTSKTWTNYNFENQPTKVYYKIQSNPNGRSTDTKEWTETYTYYHNSASQSVVHQIKGQAAVTIAYNIYDELGRMKQKLQNGAGSGSIAQIRTNYYYNIQSWLTKIQAKDAKYNRNLLDLGLDYYESSQGTSGRYRNKYVNGNISRMRWQVGLGDNQYYDFAYDVNNRLTGADYVGSKNYDANYSYNRNGI